MQNFTRTYKLVQFSVQSEGLLGELGPLKVVPHCMPLHVLICRLHDFILYMM